VSEDQPVADGQPSVSEPYVTGEQPLPPPTRLARLWAAADVRGIPLRAILATVGIVVAAYFAGKLVYRLREVLLLMLVSGFVALILNPLVVALQRWKIKRRGWAVMIVTFWGLLVFFGLAIAFGVPLANGFAHLADSLPSYVRQAEHGQGTIGHLVRKYHVATWVQHNAPKLLSVGQGLAKPALSLGKGAFSLLLALATIFVLVLLLLLEGPHLRIGILGLMPSARAERFKVVAREVNRSVTGYMLGNVLTSLIAGVVVLITLITLGVPFPFLWALWVALVDFLPMIGGGAGRDPDHLVRGRALADRRDHHAGGVPGLHPDREPPAQPAHHEPDGQGQPAARPDLDPGRRISRQLDRRHLRRVRGRAARDPGRRRDPGHDPRTMASHRPRPGPAAQVG
jgi:predicted PurR-regulated permease PerM